MGKTASGKRTDNRGRILKTGESQTKEGKYVYKYTVRGEQKFAYSWRLNETDPLPKGKKAKPPLREIEKEFKENVAVIYHDNYYRRQDEIPFEDRIKANYDHPDSLETQLLLEHLHLLKDGKAIDCPVYDYSQHNRSNETIHIEPKPIIITEGILLLADKRLRNLLDIKIYVEADADERILRRVVRDVKERGRDIDNIVD